jgi:hypothetical protein
MYVVPVQKKFLQPVLLRRPALARNRYQVERCFETTPDVASMRASFVLVVIGRVMLSDRTTQLLRRHAVGTNRNQVLLQHMLYWRLVLRDRPSQLLRRPTLDTGRNKVGAAHVHEYLEHNRQPLELVVLPHHRLVAQQAEAVAAPMKSLPLRQLRLCGSVGVSKNHMVVTAKAGCPWKQILEASVTTWAWVWLCRLCVCTPPVAQSPSKAEPSQPEGAGQATTAGIHGYFHYECLGGARPTLDFWRCHLTKIERR